MNLNDYKGILVFAEQRDGVIQNVGLELIGKAKELAAKLDVPVTAALIGDNVEGLAKTLVSLAKDAINKGGILAKLGALMLMPALKKLGKDIDVSEYGGAPLLGVNGCCIISHGSSNAKAICSAIRQASEFVQKDVITQIRDNIDKEEIWSHDTEVK